MSGHERDHRVHRHGLAPLPADASGEQREARIAELRQLRRTRRRTLALRGGFSGGGGGFDGGGASGDW